MQTCRSSRKSISIFPVPSTTEASGSSAIETGNPVSSRMRLSKFFSSAPPPVSTMPRRRAAEEFRQAHPGRNRVAGFDRGRSAGFGGTGYGKDAERFPAAAASLHRLRRVFSNQLSAVSKKEG